MSTSTSELKLSRKDRERELHRREILAAAERLFASKGYRATTVEEIAREAEFAVGTIYTLFKDKDDLYTSIIEDFACELLGHLEQTVVPMADATEALAAMIELRLRHFHVHRAFLRSALEAVPILRVSPAAACPARAMEIFERYMKLSVELVARGIAQRHFVPEDPQFLALAIEGIIHAHAAHWSRLEPAEPLEVLVDRLKHQILGLVVTRRPAPAKPLSPTGDSP